MSKILILICLSLFYISCSSDDMKEAEPEPVEIEEVIDLTLNLTLKSPYTVTFSYSYPQGYSNVKLIRGSTSQLNLNFFKQELILNENGSTISINRLTPKNTYYFRLAALINGVEHYSDIIPVTMGNVLLTYNDELNTLSNSYTFIYEKVIKIQDGYLVGIHRLPNGGQDSAVVVFKLDENFNTLWRVIINESETRDDFIDLIALDDGNFAVLGNAYKGDSSPPFDIGGNYITKLTNSGDRLWTKTYRYNEGTPYDYSRNYFMMTSAFQGHIKTVSESDTTQFNSNDSFARVLEIDNNGNLVSEEILSHQEKSSLIYPKFDAYGNLFNYGKYFNGNEERFIEKFNPTHDNEWSKNYGSAFDWQHRVEGIYIDDDKILAVSADSYSVDGTATDTNLIFKTDPYGNLVWDYKIAADEAILHLPEVKYFPKDITEQAYGEVIALYEERGNGLSYSSITVLDTNGNPIWKLDDNFPVDFHFIPDRIFIDGFKYTVFGDADGIPWIRQYTLEVDSF